MVTGLTSCLLCGSARPLLCGDPVSPALATKVVERTVVGDSGSGSRSRPLSVRVFPALAGAPLEVGVGCRAARTFWSGSSISRWQGGAPRRPQSPRF